VCSDTRHLNPNSDSVLSLYGPKKQTFVQSWPANFEKSIDL